MKNMMEVTDRKPLNSALIALWCCSHFLFLLGTYRLLQSVLVVPLLAGYIISLLFVAYTGYCLNRLLGKVRLGNGGLLVVLAILLAAIVAYLGAVFQHAFSILVSKLSFESARLVAVKEMATRLTVPVFYAYFCSSLIMLSGLNRIHRAKFLAHCVLIIVLCMSLYLLFRFASYPLMW